MRQTSAARIVPDEVTQADLEKKFFEPRSLVNNLLTILAWEIGRAHV